MKPDDVISYHDVVNAERAALQKGVNFGIGKDSSVFLMSVRRGAATTRPQAFRRMYRHCG